MPSEFLQTASVFLTPISPLHIGCGEVYEPIQYVIQDGILYAFDPTIAALPTHVRGDLLRTTRTGTMLDLACFFSRNAQFFIPASRTAFPVDPQIAKTYLNMVGKKMDRNRNLIERTEFGRLSEDDEVYVPGSAVKGAVHTALLDRINDGRPIDHHRGFNFDKNLLGGDFAESPMRFLKIADFMPTQAIPRHAAMAKRFYKKAADDTQTPHAAKVIQNGPIIAAEVIDSGTYRAFESRWSLSLDEFRQAKHCYRSFCEIAADLNRKSKIALTKELAALADIDDAQSWVRSIKPLLAQLEKAFQQALLRWCASASIRASIP